jgi:hypothetical protein
MIPQLNEVFRIYELARQPGKELAAAIGKVAGATSPSHSSVEEPQLDTHEADELGRVIAHFGIEKVAQLFRFAYGWKYENWDEMRQNKSQHLPDASLCRAVFARAKVPGLYRGVGVEPRSHWGRAINNHPSSNMSYEIKIKKRSISSWTKNIDVAEKFAFGIEGGTGPGQIGMVMQIDNPGDVYVLAAPADGHDVPGWYRKFYYAMTEAGNVYSDDEEGREGENEYILSLSRCSVKIVIKRRPRGYEDDDEPSTPDWKDHRRQYIDMYANERDPERKAAIARNYRNFVARRKDTSKGRVA